MQINILLTDIILGTPNSKIYLLIKFGIFTVFEKTTQFV